MLHDGSRGPPVRYTWSRDGKTLPSAGAPDESTTATMPIEEAAAAAGAATDARVIPRIAGEEGSRTEARFGAAAASEAAARTTATLPPALEMILGKLIVESPANSTSGVWGSRLEI